MADAYLLPIISVLAIAAVVAAAASAGATVPETGVKAVDEAVDKATETIPSMPSKDGPEADDGVPAPAAPGLPGSQEGPGHVSPPTTSGPTSTPWTGVVLGAGALLVIGAAVAVPPFAARNPGAPARARPQTFSPAQHLTHGIEMLQKADFRGAVPHLRHGLRARPTDPSARYALGSALARKGDVREALVQLDYAIRLNEDYLAILVQDPDLRSFTDRPEVYRFIRTHAARYTEKTRRGFA